MRVARVKRVMLIGIGFVAVWMFYHYFKWQLELSGMLPLVSSSQRQTYSRLKQKLFEADKVKEKKCMSSYRKPENITSSDSRRFITAGNIDIIIANSGLKIQDALETDVTTIFSRDALMISGLPYFTARIPAVVFHHGWVLAFCEARFEGVRDVGEMMIAMRRGQVLHDGDVRWEKVELIAGIRTFRTMNPSPIVDRINGAIVLVFAAFPSSMSFNEMMSFSNFPMSKLYVITSYDSGASWTEPADITSQTILKMRPNPVLLVPGPGHSIQMACGRIIVPINYFTRDENSIKIRAMCGNCTNYNRIIYSDDGGMNWQVGERSKFTHDAILRPIYLNEVQAVEVEDNTICLNSRTLQAAHPRAISMSHDGGKTISPSYLARELVEPGYKRDGSPMAGGGCAGSVIGFDAPSSTPLQGKHNHPRWVLFSNPADRSFRLKLSIRLSIDGCRTWSKPFRIFKKKAAYSDLSYFEATINGRKQRMVAVLYEGGFESVVEGMKFKMFNLEAILSGIRSEIMLGYR